MAKQSGLNEVLGGPDENGRVSVGEYNAYMADKPERATGETATEFNKRVTQWYKEQPHNELTPEQAAAGATLQWVRTGIGGEGQYKVVYPLGVAYDKVTGQPLKVQGTGNLNPNSQPLPTGSYTIVKKGPNPGGNGTLVTYKNTDTGEIIEKVEYTELGSTEGDSFTNGTVSAEKKAARQSAYDLLYNQFKQYGLESLVESIKGLIEKDVSPSQFTIELRNSPAYLKRFAANAQRIKAGYRALDEGTYLALEDSYQNLMRNYGLPASYWEKGELGAQPGFEKLIAGNVDPIELEQRLIQAVDQIEKGPKEYMDAIKQFYPEISRSDLLSYVLDPANALKAIQSKVKAAQIGGEYLRAGLGTQLNRAEELARGGVTAEMARANIPTIMEAAKRGGELAGFYGDAGVDLYDQATAEEEIYNLGKAAEAKKKREKLVALEAGSFSGTSGLTRNALDTGRSGAY